MRAMNALVGIVLLLEALLPALYLAIVFGGEPFGVSTYVVESGSMEPRIQVGSLVYVDRSFEAERAAPDEVIAFEIDGANAEVCTHRIVANDIESRSVRTKGDSNKEIDATPIPYTSIIGRVVLSIPHLGFIAYRVSEYRLVVVIAYVLILAATLLVHRSIQRKRKRTFGLRRRNTYGIKDQCREQRAEGAYR